MRGKIHVVLDAQRKEFYHCAYELGSAAPRAASPLRLVNQEEVLKLQSEGGTLVGCDIGKWFPDANRVHPRAAMLGQMASGRVDTVNPENLEPIYLRETSFVKAPAPRIW
jgi:tRNA A37 threonylcarbamoyladenosine modification protein TsaB